MSVQMVNEHLEQLREAPGYPYPNPGPHRHPYPCPCPYP